MGKSAGCDRARLAWRCLQLRHQRNGMERLQLWRLRRLHGPWGLWSLWAKDVWCVWLGAGPFGPCWPRASVACASPCEGYDFRRLSLTYRLSALWGTPSCTARFDTTSTRTTRSTWSAWSTWLWWWTWSPLWRHGPNAESSLASLGGANGRDGSYHSRCCGIHTTSHMASAHSESRPLCGVSQSWQWPM